MQNWLIFVPFILPLFLIYLYQSLKVVSMFRDPILSYELCVLISYFLQIFGIGDITIVLIKNILLELFF